MLRNTSSRRNHAFRAPHEAAELLVDVLINLARERERQRRRDAAVALDDVAVVPDCQRRVRIAAAGQ